MKNKYNDGYYHVMNDILNYPEASIIIAWSHRGPGKTYGCLWDFYQQDIKFMYMKRTNDDVTAICERGGLDSDSDTQLDLSPYAPINRDHGTNIRPFKIAKGLGGFWNVNEEGQQEGPPVSILASLNAIKTIKGFEASDCDYVVLDEFIPQKGERVLKQEGEMLLGVVLTVQRDRLKRGKQPVKLILFANAEDISTPITRELEVMDDIADMQEHNESIRYIENRGILLHHITAEEVPVQSSEDVGIFKAMKGTAFARKSFEGEFANNDFTNVRKQSLKNYSPMIHLRYKNKDYYIYYHEDQYRYYMCKAQAKCEDNYDLSKENDQKAFFYDWCIDLREACIDDRMKFQTYTMYDLIINYKKLFQL